MQFLLSLGALLASTNLLPRSLSPPTSTPNLAPHTRDIIYLPGLTDPITNNTHHSLYTEHLLPHPPPRHKKPTLLLLHGSAHTGAMFTYSPGGTPSWTNLFLGRSYPLLIPDTLSQGRSAFALNSKMQVGLSPEVTAQFFTNTAKYSLWPQAKLHTQWPGAGEPGDPVFDRHYAGYVPIEAHTNEFKVAMRDRVVELVRNVIKDGEEVVVVGHSAGGLWATGVVDVLDGLREKKAWKGRVKGLVLLEPPGPPFEDKIIFWDEPPTRVWGLTDYEIRYDPRVIDPMVDIVARAVKVGVDVEGKSACWVQGKPVRKLVAFGQGKAKVLIVTGEASWHDVYDHCTAGWFRQAGATVEHYRLGEMGLGGNGHMFFLEKNAEAIWEKVEGWIAKL